MGMEGYNIFGKNKFFAPRVRWSTLETRVRRAHDAAKDYEDAFNNVIQIENVDSNFNQVSVPDMISFSRPTVVVTVRAFD